MTHVGIVDLGVSNLGSLHAGLSRMGTNPILLKEGPRDIDISRLILPGVGSYAEAIKRLKLSGLFDYVVDAAHKRVPILGICLGMQLLSNSGEEGGFAVGLGLIPGRTVKMESSSTDVRIPHVGWNSVNLRQEHPLFTGIADNTDFYFVHSFCVRGAQEENAIGLTSHGEPFQSVVANGNVIGVQFHPEKSQKNGVQLMKNFIEWVP